VNEIIQYFVVPAVFGIVLILILMGAVAYTTLLERKVIAFIQVRLGPNRVGPWGLLQPIADGLKLLLKEDIIPARADKVVFTIAPVLCVLAAIGAFAVIPFAGANGTFTFFGYAIKPVMSDINVGILFVMAISSIGVFGIVLGGWASNSKYPLLGGLRSAAQMISYEVPFGLALIGPLMLAGTASMQGIIRWQNQHVWLWLPQLPALVIFYIAGVAENNRAPFDLPEAESELVAGFHTEYSGMKFAFFFLGEYMSMIVVSAMVVTVFFGGWLPATFGLGYLIKGLPVLLAGGSLGAVAHFLIGVLWFSIKVFFVMYVYLWIRATFPRYRYDQLMNVGWKFMIPASLAWVLITGFAVLLWDAMFKTA
jgi:NADH-quinone oxidoreductase subunit H